MGIRYATREDVKDALDSAETARNNAQVDRAIDDATDAIHGLCHRVFYPELRTMTWDWPNSQSPTFNRLWLDDNELIELISAESGGVTIPTGNLLLRPDSGPPFTYVETDNSSSAAFAAGATTQRAVSFYGLFGFRNDERDAGVLANSPSSSTATVDVSSSAMVGVGSLLRCGTERMIVTEKSMVTTGQTLQADLTVKNNDVVVHVADGTGFAANETILIDGERMQVQDTPGNTLIVKRAWDGSVLAAHTGNPVIYASRRCTVERGVLGTTAAAHSATDPLFAHKPPSAVRTLAIAEALVVLGQEGYGYLQQLRPLEGGRRLTTTIQDRRDQVYAEFGRKTRIRTVS